MTTHRLKTWPEPFAAVVSGEKTHEVRKDDRGFKVGDTLVLCEWIPESATYTSSTVTRTVTHIARGWGLPLDLCVVSIVPWRGGK